MNVPPDIAAVMQQISARVRDEAVESGQMSLGAIISALRNLPRDRYISFGFAGLVPGDFNSYRGYYDHLAIDPTSHARRTVGEVLDAATACMGRKFEGYKGGAFVMDEDTPLWVAKWGDSTGTRIVGLDTSSDWKVVVLTTQDKD